jgi:hypothetical protein
MGIRRLVTGMTIVGGGLLLTACGLEDRYRTTASEHETVHQDISEVRFTNDSGDVKITVGDRVEVRTQVHYADDTPPGKTYRVAGDVLVLEQCEKRNCWVDYEVTVPEDVAVTGHLDSGAAEVTGVRSANVASESGDVTIRDVAGEVNVSAQSGDLDLSGIGGAVVAEASSGNVTIRTTAARNVSASADSGNIELTVPAGDYRVRAEADSGSVTDEVGDAGSGPTLDLRADSGDVTIRRA